MSLVNQMLQDLERRRTAEDGSSPLGGLSASGAAVARPQSINYLLLVVTLVLGVAVALAFIYFFGLKQVASPVVPIVEASAVLGNAEVKAEPEIRQSIIEQASVHKISVQQPSVELEPVSAEVIPTNNVWPKVQEKSDVIVVEKIASPKKMAMNREAETDGLISIREPKLKNESLFSPVDTKTTEENKTVRSPVNKTIRPLTSEQQAQMAFQDAVKLLGRGDEFGAQQKLEKALSIEPVHTRARETLSALLLNTGRISEAAESLSEGLRLRPTSTPLAKLYARVLVDQGDSDAAIAVLERARPLVASDPDYYALMAVLYRGAGKHAQASQVYQQILQVRPGVAVWWMGLALSEDAMTASERALEAYQRAQRSGGLRAEVLQYVQSRIAALTAGVSEKAVQAVADDSEGFED